MAELGQASGKRGWTWADSFDVAATGLPPWQSMQPSRTVGLIVHVADILVAGDAAVALGGRLGFGLLREIDADHFRRQREGIDSSRHHARRQRRGRSPAPGGRRQGNGRPDGGC